MNTLPNVTEGKIHRKYVANQPLVSVVIIFFNAEKFLQEAIESVLCQTYKKWELLLVDDGSTDKSTAIAMQYTQQFSGKVRYLAHVDHQNRGKPASRNLGTKVASGKFVAFLDADDVWLPKKLEQQVAILESHPEATLVYGIDQYWYSWTGDPNDSQQDYVYELGVPSNTLINPPLLVRLFLEGSAAIPCPTNILVRRSAIESVGGFEEIFQDEFNTYEDQAFYAKLFLAHPVWVSDECWDKYRQHPDASCSVSETRGETQITRLFFLKWFRSYLQTQDIRDREIWRTLRKELLRSRHPIVSELLRKATYRLRQVKPYLQLR